MIDAEVQEPVLKIYWKDGFYRTDVHGESIPEGAYEITEEQYTDLLAGCDGYHIVDTAENGSPVLVEVQPDVELLKKNTAEVKIEELLREQELDQVCALIADDDDTAVLEVAVAFPEWKAGRKYKKGRILNHNSKVYRTVIEVLSLEHQPPDAEGMLAVYRPIDPYSHAGTIEDPIPWQYGLDVVNGKYYEHDDKLYLAKADLPHCIYAPGAEGVWQWELVETI